MKRSNYPRGRGGVLLVSFWLLFSAVSLRAEGTVLFANVANSVLAPLGGPGGLFGPGYMARLGLVLEQQDGLPTVAVSIGQPAPFLANGLFSAGVRNVESGIPGHPIDLVVAVFDPNGDFVGATPVVTVILGGLVESVGPPTPPALLVGLGSLSSNAPNPFDAVSGNLELPPPIILTFPEPPAPTLPPPAQIEIRMLDSNRLEIQWPDYYQLYRMRDLAGGTWMPLKAETNSDGDNRFVLSMQESQEFIWLDEDVSPWSVEPELPVEWGGRYYQLVVFDRVLDWTEANHRISRLEFSPGEGRALRGHLATITNAEEQAFIETLLPPEEGPRGRVWLGAKQTIIRRQTREPLEGWQWVTGESWDYTHWDSQEPNNSPAGEDFLNVKIGFSAAETWGTWNDELDHSPYAPTRMALVEFE